MVMSFILIRNLALALCALALAGCVGTNSLAERRADSYVRAKYGQKVRRVEPIPGWIAASEDFNDSSKAESKPVFIYAISNDKLVAIEVLKSGISDGQLRWRLYSHDGILDSLGYYSFGDTH